jgi:hypothetical protein
VKAGLDVVVEEREEKSLTAKTPLLLSAKKIARSGECSALHPLQIDAARQKIKCIISSKTTEAPSMVCRPFFISQFLAISNVAL